ncbi:MAG: 5-(carboxyamino)imidazole ribonucleotide mutase [Propionibacteriaceae bacterium]|jgi:5-(carboxyamino)imidazole ribonucleotide mutase|nr:5-(carboxyamino)imidazole ribonucleotide mutase [Propionibacteriaceae bacterium]
MNTPLVGIIMGSDSDWPIMEPATSALDEFAISWEVNVLSAHRMPDDTLAYGRSAVERGLRIIIAGASGAAHLSGVLAAVTPLPVIGVPIAAKTLDGLDSLLSTVQMPSGVPVATVGIDNARNAALLAVRMLAVADTKLRERYIQFMQSLRDTAAAKGASIRTNRPISQ